jgi:hypothetical protein
MLVALLRLVPGGTWEGMWRALLGQLDAQGKLEWARTYMP